MDKIDKAPLDEALNSYTLGQMQLTLTNFDNDSEPQVHGVVEVGEIYYRTTAGAESIGGWSGIANDSTVYIRVIPDLATDTASFEFTTTAPTWDDAKQGWYESGTNKRYVGGLYKDGSGNYTQKWLYHAIQANNPRVTLFGDGSLSLDGGIKASVMSVEDQKTENSSGQSLTGGGWNQRDLNTVVTNTITGASLASNRITLPAGLYEIMWSAPAENVNTHISRLRDVTHSATLLWGTSEFCGTPGGGGESSTASRGHGRIDLSEDTTVEIQTGCLSDGWGGTGTNIPGITVDHETFTTVWIRQLA
jgi:hypothetical protein